MVLFRYGRIVNDSNRAIANLRFIQPLASYSNVISRSIKLIAVFS